jgi:hypothetical protein
MGLRVRRGGREERIQFLDGNLYECASRVLAK